MHGFHFRSGYSHSKEVADLGPVKNPLHAGAVGGHGVCSTSGQAPTLSKKMNIPIPQNILFAPNSKSNTNSPRDMPRQQISAQFSFPRDPFSSRPQPEMLPYQGIDYLTLSF
jgi:hypothetical protein